MLSIDDFAYRSPLRHWSPHVRIGLPVIWLVIMQFITYKPLYGLILIVFATLTMSGHHVAPKLYIKALSIPAFFAVTAALGILVVTMPDNSPVLWQGQGLGRMVGLTFYVTTQSLNVAVLTIARAFASVSVVFFIVFNAPIWEIGRYMKHLKISPTFVELFVLCYRFIFVLLEEAVVMLESQVLRLGYTSLKVSFHSLGLLIGQMFVRSLNRVKAMEESLELRLYDGEFYL